MNPNIQIGFDSLRSSTKAQSGTSKANEPYHKIHHKTKLEQAVPQRKETQGTSSISGIDRVFHIIGEDGGVNIGTKQNRDAIKRAQKYFKKAGDTKMHLNIEMKIREGEKLTKKEEERERELARTLQEHQDEFTPAVYNAFEKHFKKEKILYNRTIWDDHEDLKKIKETRK